MRNPLRRYAVPIVLFLCLLATFSYFHHLAGGWNVNTRLALVYAIVDQGTLAIDSYHDTPGMSYMMTGDKAVYGGHYYCDKSPALSFMGLPVYYLLYQAREQFGFWDDAVHRVWFQRTRYLMRLFAVSIPAALLGVLLWAFAVRFGLRDEAAFAVSVAIMLGTVISGYAALFYPYLPASLCTMAAWWLALPPSDGWREAGGGSDAPEIGRGLRMFWIGLLIGLAWYLDLTSGLAGMALVAYTLWQTRHHAVPVWKAAVGGILPIIAFYTYTYWIFNEFAIPYKFEVDDLFREEMAKGFQGIHLPTFTIFYYLTLHPFKSVFFYSPVLVLVPFGIWAALRETRFVRWRVETLVVLFVMVSYLLYNSGYYMWWGGWAAGPRLLCPAMPFAVLPLAIWLREDRPARRILFGLFLGASVFWNFLILAVDPQIPTASTPPSCSKPPSPTTWPRPSSPASSRSSITAMSRSTSATCFSISTASGPSPPSPSSGSPPPSGSSPVPPRGRRPKCPDLAPLTSESGAEPRQVQGPGNMFPGGRFAGQSPPTRECFIAWQRNVKDSGGPVNPAPRHSPRPPFCVLPPLVLQ